MAADLESMYYHLQAKLQKLLLRKRARAARTNTSGRLDTWIGAKLKRLQFRAPSSIERIQADLETFAIHTEYGRTSIR